MNDRKIEGREFAAFSCPSYFCSCCEVFIIQGAAPRAHAAVAGAAAGVSEPVEPTDSKAAPRMCFVRHLQERYPVSPLPLRRLSAKLMATGVRYQGSGIGNRRLRQGIIDDR